MYLVAHEPWNVVNELQRNLHRWFDRPFSADTNADPNKATALNWAPAVDIKENDDRFVIEADVPGMAPTDIEITVDNNVLTLSGTREHSSEASDSGFHRRERVRGHFVRRFSLPPSADADAISATGNNGVLVIEISKKQQTQRKRIPVG